MDNKECEERNMKIRQSQQRMKAVLDAKQSLENDIGWLEQYKDIPEYMELSEAFRKILVKEASYQEHA